MLTIRLEEPRDIDQVRIVNERAFAGPGEAGLVDALRGSPDTLSLVAVMGDQIVGHIFFSSVRVEHEPPGPPVMGLAPLAVMPEYQRQGVGSRLVEAGLEACRARSVGVVVVLGHPAYYPKFGFVRASTQGLAYTHPGHEEAFMVLELQPGVLAHTRGVVHFRREFELF